jgi:hypothetical protein
MKAKTIAKTIKAKMDEWIESITDKQLQKGLKEGVVVTGGCITSMFLQEKVNDYDIYLQDARLALQLARYYAKATNISASVSILLHVTPEAYQAGLFDSMNPKLSDEQQDRYPNKVLMPDIDEQLSGEQRAHLTRVELFVSSSGLAIGEEEESNDPLKKAKPKEKYRPIFISSNAITLANDVQIVLRFTGDAAEIHTNYDFTHTTNYWTYKDGLIVNAEALQSILARELIYSGSLYPLASILRTRKFIQRGWSCHAGNYIKMALQLNELNLFDPDILRDQLTGVDMAYMHSILVAVETKKKDDPNFEFNAQYLCQVVSKLMDGEG